MAGPVSAELEARRTAAAAALADYRRDEAGTGEPSWAMWAGRLAAALESVLAMPPEPEPGKLAAIRAVVAAFDWEFDDRQLALEHIERIAEGQDDAAALTAAQLPTVLAALDDAATFRTERASAYCYACSGHPAGACEEHVDDLDQADAYRQLATTLGGGS